MKNWKTYFDINAIFIGDMNRPLPDSNSAWNFAYIDWLNVEKLDFWKKMVPNINILLINLSWMAQMMLGPVLIWYFLEL